jgi:hypothetical protein
MVIRTIQPSLSDDAETTKKKSKPKPKKQKMTTLSLRHHNENIGDGNAADARNRRRQRPDSSCSSYRNNNNNNNNNNKMLLVVVLILSSLVNVRLLLLQHSSSSGGDGTSGSGGIAAGAGGGGGIFSSSFHRRSLELIADYPTTTTTTSASSSSSSSSSAFDFFAKKTTTTDTFTSAAFVTADDHAIAAERIIAPYPRWGDGGDDEVRGDGIDYQQTIHKYITTSNNKYPGTPKDLVLNDGNHFVPTLLYVLGGGGGGRRSFKYTGSSSGSAGAARLEAEEEEQASSATTTTNPTTEVWVSNRRRKNMAGFLKRQRYAVMENLLKQSLEWLHECKTSTMPSKATTTTTTTTKWDRLYNVLSTTGLPLLMNLADIRYCLKDVWEDLWGDDENNNNSNNNTPRHVTLPIFTLCTSTECNYTLPLPSYTVVGLAAGKVDPKQWDTVFEQQHLDYEWSTKRRQIVWRGATTGGHLYSPRLKSKIDETITLLHHNNSNGQRDHNRTERIMMMTESNAKSLLETGIRRNMIYQTTLEDSTTTTAISDEDDKKRDGVSNSTTSMFDVGIVRGRRGPPPDRS